MASLLRDDAEISKHNLVIVGGGWAGFELVQKIDYDLYNVTIISPRRNTTYTPLLASAATGLFSFSVAEEPIRSKVRSKLHYHKATVTDIDFGSQQCTCQPAFDSSDAGLDEEINNTSFQVPYDVLVIAPGMQPSDFGTPGVKEHGMFMANVSDAMRLRKNLFDLLEKASLPTVSAKRRKELLHIAVVGGGPTGVELVAELDDLFKHELAQTYPDIAQDLSLSLYDVAPNILPMYEAKLHEYAAKQLEKRDINVSPNTKVEKVDAKALHIEGHGKVAYGMLIWATGNKNVDLVDDLEEHFRFREKGPKRILTDEWLLVLKPSPSESDSDEDDDDDDEKKEDESKFNPGPKPVYSNVFSLGDCADIHHKSLPPTAEVAVQKAQYLTRLLNSQAPKSSHPTASAPATPASKSNSGSKFKSKSEQTPSQEQQRSQIKQIHTHPTFQYKAKPLVSYIGGQDGIAMDDKSNKEDDKDDKDDKDDDGDNPQYTGSGAWVAWRGGNIMWARSWRSRIAIVIAWILNWMFGREITRM